MLPNLSLLEKVQRKIKYIPNQRKESKRLVHYCCYLLCEKAGLRVSEAVNFDLSAKSKHGLYLLNKTKGKKERFVYIPKEVISELKKHDWKPNHTNRFNFYHFLKKIKRGLSISQNVELSPHTLRRAFATHHAEAGLPLPLLSKLLGHKSVRTTALYWMNIYNEDGNDTNDIIAGKIWLERPKPPQIESENPVNLNLEEPPKISVPNSLVSKPYPDYLSKINHLENKLNQIQSKKDEETIRLKNELSQANKQKKILQNDLADSNEQNITLQHERNQAITEKHQIQQDLATAPETIDQLTRELTNEREKRLTAENNLAQEKTLLFTQRQSNQSLQETNANLRKKLRTYEQNYSNLQNTYQIALKDKQTAEMLIHSEKQNAFIQKQRADYYETQLKSIAKSIYQWQKLHYYQQLEQERNEFQAQIIQPPPWRNK